MAAFGENGKVDRIASLGQKGEIARLDGLDNRGNVIFKNNERKGKERNGKEEGREKANYFRSLQADLIRISHSL